MEANPLTADDIKVLRMKHSSICCDHYQGNKFGAIRLVPQIPGHEEIETSYTITVYSNVEDWSSTGRVDEMTGYTYIHGGAEHIRTAFSMLKPGDCIYLKWIRGNNSNYMSEAGIERDELEMHVRRDTGNKYLSFKIDTTVCKSGSYARLVKIT